MFKTRDDNSLCERTINQFCDKMWGQTDALVAETLNDSIWVDVCDQIFVNLVIEVQRPIMAAVK
jgi:hypothetical protein